jgi:hypothetical protein
MDVAACEIEEILSPPLKEKALIEYMTDLMSEKIEVIDRTIFYKGISQEEKKTQVFIACQRALFKLNSPIITFYLLQKKYPNWSDLPEFQLQKTAENIYSIWNDIEKELKHPLAEKFYRICEKYDTAYLILGDIIAENPSAAPKTLSNPETLETMVRKFYQQRLQKLKSRMAKAAFFSTVSIFVTKILVALAIEVPFDKYVLGYFDYRTLGLNVVIPSLLMFFSVLTIRPPKKENLHRVIMEVMKIVYEKYKKDVYTIKPARKKGIISGTLVVLFYLFTFLLSFGLIIRGLIYLKFSPLSMIIFLIFFCLISFAVVKIRERAKELEIEEEKAHLRSFIIDSLSLPFIRVGRWLSLQWTKYNVVVVLITAFIDMPFHLFTEFLEHWRTFLKEKKEEIH